MKYPNDGRTILLLNSGYHHYIDTGVCNNSSENKHFIIDGAVVRLIRFGCSVKNTHTSRIYNVTVTVNSGELWYLNTSYELDEFCGALTAVFNNGTYASFLEDYSTTKITPQKGRYFIDSPAVKGMKIIPSDTPGYFIVSGEKQAFCLSEDGAKAYYSISSYLSLPPGKYTIKYAKSFSTSLLPSPGASKYWHDNGNGSLVLLDKKESRTVYVDASLSADKASDNYFSNIEQAVLSLGDNDGTVKIIGSVPFTTLPMHKGVITYEGENNSAELIFEKQFKYYLFGDTIFKNINLQMNGKGDKSSIISNSHSLVFGKNLSNNSTLLSSTSGTITKSERIIIQKIVLAKKPFPTRITTRGCGFLYCFQGSGYLTYEHKVAEITAGDAFVAPVASHAKLDFHEDSVLLGVFFTLAGNNENILPNLIKGIISSYTGDVFTPILNNSEIINDSSYLAALSFAIERATGIKSIKKDLFQMIAEYIDQNYSTIHSVDIIAEEFHLNRSYLERKYKKATGIGLKQAIIKRRCQAATVLMKKGYAIKEIAQIVGYSSTASFSKAFKNETGSTPTKTQKIITN